MSSAAYTPLVCVIDDDDAVRDSLRWLLGSAGYRVATFASAECFLTEYRPGTASCVIVDVRLPGMSGLRLQDELNKLDLALPIIFMTAAADPDTATEAITNGAFHFLQKPFPDTQLLRLLEQASFHGAEALKRLAAPPCGECTETVGAAREEAASRQPCPEDCSHRSRHPC
jgi:two-component system, LuxR family, response regulator TtrR